MGRSRSDRSKPSMVKDRLKTSVPSTGVARRAYELFLERGGDHGRDVDDWLKAERELKGSRIARTQ